MANIASPDLNAPQVAPIERPLDSSNQYSASDWASAGKSISDIGEEYKKYRTEKAANVLGNAGTDLLGGVDAYNKKVASLRADLVNASPDAAASIMSQLTKIKNGEMQGIKSPTQAMLDYHRLAKDMSIRYSFAAPTIRQLAGVFSGEVSQFQSEARQEDQSDPVTRGQSELISKAASLNITPQQLLSTEKNLARSKEASSNLAEASARGHLLQNDVTHTFDAGNQKGPYGEFIKASRDSFIDASYQGLMQLQQQGKTTKEEVVPSLYASKLSAERGLNEYLDTVANSEKIQGTVGGQIIFDNKAITEEVLRPFDDLIKAAENGDGIERVLRLSNAQVQLQKNADFQATHAVVGALAGPLLSSTDPLALATRLFELRKDINHELGGDLSAAAKYDPALNGLMGLFGDPAKLNGAMAGDAAAKLNGTKTDPTLHPVIKAHSDALIGHIVTNDPDISRAANRLTTVLQGDNPLDFIAKASQADQSKYKVVFQNDATLRKTFEQRMTEKFDNLAANMTVEDLSHLIYNKSLNTWSWDGNRSFNMKSLGITDTYTGALGSVITQGSSSVPNTGGQELVNYLNQYTKIKGLYTNPTKLGQETGDYWHQRVVDRVTDASNAANDFLGKKGRTLGTDTSGNLMENGKALDPSNKLDAEQALNIANDVEANKPELAQAIRQMYGVPSQVTRPTTTTTRKADPNNRFDNPTDKQIPVDSPNPLDNAAAVE